MNLWTAASQKAAAIDNDTSQFRKNSELLDHAKRQYPERERAIYRAVSLLRQSDRHLYDKTARTKADVVAGNVDAARKGILMVLGRVQATALQSAGAVSAIADLSFRKKRRRKSEMI
ncbi:hypothetical protein N7452_001432 [Penicillium brevicompactum]|uniref:Uncharacterized protein n=1 Tax=Penicillium brevicompactum TaxID=5074 RepID=A0A9W9R2D9_PENBR|nr:hypothetical protein N7452_001432 [Penicillium brevicompactum]